MSSNHGSPRVPQIVTSRPNLSPSSSPNPLEHEYDSSSPTPPQEISEPSNGQLSLPPLSGSPTPLSSNSRTPITNASSTPGRFPFPGESLQSRADSPSPNRCYARPTPSSDTLSRIGFNLGFESQSSGGSYFSTHTSHKLYSESSGELLSPPKSPDNAGENPPYRAPTPDSSSLTMIAQIERAMTVTDHKKQKIKRRRRRPRCHHTHGKYSRNHSGRVPMSREGCWVRPDTQAGFNGRRRGPLGGYRPAHLNRANTDTNWRKMPQATPGPLTPVISRRWSSVEVREPSESNSRSEVTLSTSAAPRPGKTKLLKLEANDPSATSSSPPHSDSSEIVRAIRQGLTLRRVSEHYVQTPAVITLKRASPTSGVSRSSTIVRNPSFQTSDMDAVTHLATLMHHPVERQGSKYLISREEIDSISELIESYLKRNHRSYEVDDSRNMSITSSNFKLSRTSSLTVKSIESSTSTIKNFRPPVFTRQGIVPTTSSPIQSTITVAQVQSLPIRAPGSEELLMVAQKASLQPQAMTKSRLSKSKHEVIWEASCPIESVIDREYRQESISDVSCSNNSSLQSTRSQSPRLQTQGSPEYKRPKLDRIIAFDPNNANNSIEEWSWQLPQNGIPLTPSESESNVLYDTESLEQTSSFHGNLSKPHMKEKLSDHEVLRSPTSEDPISVTNAIGDMDTEYIISFPPLPRKTTNYWCSSPPEIGHPPRRQSTPLLAKHRKLSRRSSSTHFLSKVGIDESGIPVTKVHKHDTSGPSRNHQTLLARIRSDEEYQSRRKSVVKPHPRALGRLGKVSTMGSSVGCSSRERRKSSTRSIRSTHAQYIDNANRPSTSRNGTWSQARPPTPAVVLSTRSSSPLDDFDDDYPTIDTAREIPRHRRSGPVDHMMVIEDASPPTSTLDHSGIYEMLTGARTMKRSDEEPVGRGPSIYGGDPRHTAPNWMGQQ